MMQPEKDQIEKRKREHLELCKTDEVAFKHKTAGFEQYEFLHAAATEVRIDKIDLSKKFLEKRVSYPFIISCMTGGTREGENINLQLAEVSSALNIPLGLGSVRFALGEDSYLDHFREIRKKAGNIPILSNIGAAQLIGVKSYSTLQKIHEAVEADALVIHLNPLQELLQKNGEPEFHGIFKALKHLIKNSSLPIIVKEVGAGISKQTAEKLLDAGVQGIDVAGAGGTSWAGVELLRNHASSTNEFWDWGLPTTYCIRTVHSLKKRKKFLLIGSGGISSSFDMAKALILGADFTASARIILQKLTSEGISGTVKFLEGWFSDLRRIMFLTDSQNFRSFGKRKLILKKDCF